MQQSDRITTLREEGNQLFKSSDFDSAIEKYQEAVRCIESSLSTNLFLDVQEALYNNISQCYLKQEKWGEAVNAADKVLQMNFNNEKALYRRSLGYEGLGKFKESLLDASSLVKRGNKNAISVANRVQMKLLEERNNFIDAMLPDRAFSVLATALKDLQEKQRSGQSPLPTLEAADEVIHTIDTLRTYIIKYNQRKLLLRNEAISTLVGFLTLGCYPADMGQEGTDLDPIATRNSERTDSKEDKWIDPASSRKNNEETGSPQTTDEKKTNKDIDDIASKEEQPSNFGTSSLSQLISNHEMVRIHVAIWRLLTVFVTDMKFDEDQQDREERLERQLHMLGKPIEVDPVVDEARKMLLSCLKMDEVNRIFKAYVRAGLGSLDEPSSSTKSNIHDNSIRSRCVVLITDGLRSIGSLDDVSCLEILSLGISSIECHDVVRGSLQALAGLADARRRYGSKVKALKNSQALMKALENTLQALAIEGNSQIKDDAEFALTSIFTLLADKDRAPGDEINIQDLSFVLLGPYFVDRDEPMNSYIGLRALLLLWMADRESVKSILSANSSINVLLHLTCERNPQCSQLQHVAAEVLMHAMEFRELRSDMLEVDGVTQLSELCRCQLRHEQDADLRTKVVATLARLCMHSEEVRKKIFEEFDFFRMASQTLSQFKVIRPDSKRSNSNVSKSEFKQRIRSFLEVLFFLTLHGAFKSTLLKMLEHDSCDSPSSFVSTLSDIGESLVNEKDGLGGYYFSNIFCNLLRSREDRERRRRNPNQSAPELDDEQLDALQEFFDKLPEHSRPQQKSQFDRGGTEVVKALTELLTKHQIIRWLSQLCTMKNSTLNEISAASEAISLFVKDAKYRGIVVKQGAVAGLLAAVQALKGGGVIYEQDYCRSQQSLAQICISINPALFQYHELLDIVPHLLSLLSHTYELYQYEAALALTNLTSVSEEVRHRVFRGQGWRALMDVATGENDLCRAAGLEGLCNMAMCDLVQDRFAEGLNSVDLQLLLAFLGERDNLRAQSAASGCLAILSSDARVALRLCNISNIGNIAKTIQDESQMKEKPAVLIRLATIASNIAEAVKIKKPILVKPPKSEDEIPLTVNVTDEMVAISYEINHAFKVVNHSYYGEDVLKLITPLIEEKLPG